MALNASRVSAPRHPHARHVRTGTSGAHEGSESVASHHLRHRTRRCATAVRTLKLGAFDFLEKPVDAEALADAIEAASRVSVEASQGALPKQAVEQILAEMSPREHEITELLKEGLANHDIAERLDLSDRTVQGHRNNIYKKLRVHNLKQFLTVLEGG